MQSQDQSDAYAAVLTRLDACESRSRDHAQCMADMMGATATLQSLVDPLLHDHPVIQVALNDVPVYKARVDATLAQADKYVKGQFSELETRLDNICSQIAIDQSTSQTMQAHMKEKNEHFDTHFARLVAAINELQEKMNELLNKPGRGVTPQGRRRARVGT